MDKDKFNAMAKCFWDNLYEEFKNYPDEPRIDVFERLEVPRFCVKSVGDTNGME